MNMAQASRLIRLRTKMGLSQRAMAEEFGVTHGALAMWEKGLRPIPEIALKLISIYEEYVDEELALKKHEPVIRKLSSSWADRLILSFGRGAKGSQRESIRHGLENSLYSFFRHELSFHHIKRTVQVATLERAVKVAAQTKGLPMKMLQMMTFLHPTMTPEARAALEKIHQLQYPMAPTLVAKIITEDLGASPYKLFAEWNPKPIAAASIGQVHTARLKTGEKVAMKIQYPDVELSLKKDLDSLKLFVELVVLFNPDVRDIAGKVAEAVLRETDFFHEMDCLESFYNLFKGDEKIIIPKIYRRFSSSRIITMDYIEGQSLEEFRSAPSNERRQACETISRFVTESAFKTGLMNTDTNAGNFIFCGDGKVGFIDFGRTAKIGLSHADLLLEAVILKDMEKAQKILPYIFQTKQKRELPYDEIWNSFLQQQKHLHCGEFRFTREYIARALEEAKTLSRKHDLKMSLELVWSSATSLGLWNVFADLDVAVDYGKISLSALGRRQQLSAVMS